MKDELQIGHHTPLNRKGLAREKKDAVRRGAPMTSEAAYRRLKRGGKKIKPGGPVLEKGKKKK